MPASRVLLLGGTAEARRLAEHLSARADVDLTVTLAGRTSDPAPSAGTRRIGGFGGAGGLARYLEDRAVSLVIDASHPFADGISGNAAQACAVTGVACLRLERPGWLAGEGDRWVRVADTDAAAAWPAPGCRIWLTIGRQDLAPFAARDDLALIVRSIEPPEIALPPGSVSIHARPPFTLAEELNLIDTHRVGLVVTKDAGGDETVAKLEAARRRRLTVVMIERPAGRPAADAETVEALMDLVAARLGWQ